MNTAIDIGWSDLALGFILLIIPFFALWYYKTGLLKPAIISVIRMTGQQQQLNEAIFTPDYI